MAKKPTKKRRNTRRPSARRPVREQVRRPQPRRSDEEEEMLAEFSDDTNEFYVDEVQQRRESSRNKKNDQKKKPKKPEKQRKPLSPTQRKLIRILSYGAIVSVVLIVGVILSLTVLFKTQTYEVSGVTKYTEEAIIEASGISKGENIFLAPKSPAEKRIKQEFPYVEDVTVSFKIPDAIRISVVEAVEGYLVKMNSSDYLVISTKGRILEQTNKPDDYDLPIFIGPKLQSGSVGDYVSYEDESVLDMIEGITQTFADNGYQGITEIDATNSADISFTYDDRVKVKLGIPEDLDYKIRTAMTIINENLDKNGSAKGILDVSRCNSTKRSYFNEQEIHPTEVKPSEAATEASDDAQWSGEVYYDDSYDDSYSDDSYVYEGDYSGDYGDYSGDSGYNSGDGYYE
ncbi:MAG: FtsQ-type POTRA domain-containing protein [Ruminococcus sp.]|nr:FtsQ-type POTRA domain-containing protein [Ruminococcus sp.]